MGNLNRAILTGNLTADPVVRYTKNEKPVAHFTIAINRNGNGEADFVDCVSWGGLAKICGEYLKKGRLVAVEGRIQVRKYQAKDGQNRKVTEIVASNMQMLDKKFEKASKKIQKEEELVQI